MKYLSFLILFITLLSPAGTRAADDRYRVEVLVLLHLQHAEAGKETDRLRDYSDALDFLTPVPEPEPLPPECQPEPEELPEIGPVEDAVTELAVAGPAGDPAVDEALEEDVADVEVSVDPNAVVHVTEMGPEMQEAWRRLRLSGPFRPLQYLAWEQGSSEPFPALRIHDDQVVLLDDPWSDLREAEDELGGLYQDDPGIANAEETALADDALPDCTPPEEDELPPPVRYYALDGSVSLLRSRFLHLDLDLQLREPLTTAPAELSGSPVRALLPGDFDRNRPVGTVEPETLFRTHALAQRRQVRSGRMEYFDNPVLGVLAWITPIPLEAPAER